MKINLTDYDLTGFNQNEVLFCDIPAVIIFPEHIGVKFTQKTSIFRSSVWAKETGELLSAGLKKFVNFGENPENFPVPLGVDGVQFVTKIDGSLCIIDYVNGKVSMRTRGTATYLSLENYIDFECCLIDSPKIVDWLKSHPNYSVLCEITTPAMRIILDYGNTPRFWLVACINKADYSLMTQSELDKLAIELGVNRPESYTFNTIEECLETVKTWDGKEGVCLYHGKDQQQITKIKAEIYLKLHRFKSEASLDNTVELYVEYGCPTYNDFISTLTAQYDFECMQMILPFASKVLDAWKETQKIINHMKEFVKENDGLIRKDFALKVISAWGNTNRASFLFTLKDKGELTVDQKKKLIFQSIR